MGGPGGIGSVPSSRLTKILQEKAALLKQQRESAEEAFHEVEARIQQLDAIEVALPGVAEKVAHLHDLVRRSDWVAVETQSKTLHQEILSTAGPAFEAKRKQIAERAERLIQFGLPLPEGFSAALEGVGPSATDTEWGRSVGLLAQLEEWVRGAQTEYSARLRTRAREFAEWAGATPEQLAALDAKLRVAVEPIAEGRFADAAERVEQLLTTELPEAVRHRDGAKGSSAEILAAGRDLGVPTQELEAAIQADAEASVIDWPKTVTAVEAAGGQLADALRERVAQVVQGLRATLSSLKDYDVDPASYLVLVEDAAARVPTASATELPRLLKAARQATEEPVVSIVASLLDAVRPKLVEVRRLGRDATEVFAAMNRAREALRLKIYSEALAASQEAIDRVGGLTEDLEAARGEAESLAELLRRLAASRFPAAPYEEALARAREHLDRIELEPAREILSQTLRKIGGETVQYFTERFAQFDRVFQFARDRGFLPSGAEDDLARARTLLDGGQLGEAAELSSAMEVRVRTAAGPYVARRVEELESGFKEIPDESLVAPVKRLLADADVNLRVREDLTASVESLRRAEREFSAVFAAHASTLVEMLEEERKVLEAMGGTGDEIQRQIDEVQQIFNMGDFVKASRTSQEIRTRAQQQQLVRSEEAVSHAKLALVELGKMGLEAGTLRAQLDSAQEASRDRRYSEAYRLAHGVLEAATATKTTAQSVLDAMSSASDLWQTLKQSGVQVDDFREQLKRARDAYQSLNFSGALATVNTLIEGLRAVGDEAAARRLLGEVQLLVEDARRLSLPTDPYAESLSLLQRALEEHRPTEALETVRRLHAELISVLRPVLDESIRGVEQDLEVARSAGLEAPEVVELLGEARRRLGLTVPTGVGDLLEKARSQLVESRGFLEHAERELKRVRDAINEAELVRVDVAASRARLAELEAALSRREYARVIEQGSTLERELIQAASHQVSKTLATFQAMVTRTRHAGSDTALAENLLRQARQDLEEGRFVEALQKASRSETELERVELQLRIAEGTAATMERKVADARANGIRSSDADMELERVKKAFESHAYSDVLEHSINLTDLLASARESFRRAREALDSADRQVMEAMELGADLQDVVPVLDQARRAQQAGEYSKSTQLARESAEGARWAVERLYTGALGELRGLLEIAAASSVEAPMGPVRGAVEEAEVALKSRDWARANEALSRARSGARSALDAHVRSREAALGALYERDPSTVPAELEARDSLRKRVAEEREKGAYTSALQLLAEEAARVETRRKEALEGRLNELKDRLWIGEKLGLDTTPVMELFSEAGLAVQAGRLEEVGDRINAADAQLKSLVAGRLGEKFEEVQTELNFAREGLHVTVDPVADDLRQVAKLRADGEVLLAARGLLTAADELNRRKALHRELMNLHYLVDAALARATDRHLDTTVARKLLEESLQARATDYTLALAKAREALQQLQAALKSPDTPTGFWAIRRPPTLP